MPSRRRRILPLAAVVLVAAVGAAWWATMHDQKGRGALVLHGNVDVREANLAFKVGGRIAAVLVQEGDSFKKGAVLARLETAEYEAGLAQAKGAVMVQKNVLAELVNGLRPEEIAQARAAVAGDDAAVNNARLVFLRQQQLLKTGDTSRQAYDTARWTLQQAEAALAGARAGLALAIEGVRPERIAAARGQAMQAQAEATLAEQHLADTVLVAPDDGVVLSRVHEPGTIAQAGETIVGVVFTTPTWVRAYVAEPDLGRVRPGQKAEIRTDGGKIYHGQVGYISPLAEFTPKTVETDEQRPDLVYRLRVVVEDNDNGLRQGMPVTVGLSEGP